LLRGDSLTPKATVIIIIINTLFSLKLILAKKMKMAKGKARKSYQRFLMN